MKLRGAYFMSALEIIRIFHLKFHLLAAAIIVGSTATAMAGMPGKDWISVDQAKANLMAAGYTNVTTIEADDGYYEGLGVKGGSVHKFHVDPYTGAITRDEIKR